VPGRYSGTIADAAGALNNGLDRASSRTLPYGDKGGKKPPCSEAYIENTSPNCFRLFWHELRRAASRARASAGSNKAARIPITAITTSNSMSVKPRWRKDRFSMEGTFTAEEQRAG